VEGAVENVGAYVDFGISVWTNSYVDEDHLHVNVNKGYERLNLETPGNDLDSYNQVVFDPDTMDDLNSNTFFRGESFVCWWRFNNVDLHLAPNPLMRVSVLVEYYA